MAKQLNVNLNVTADTGQAAAALKSLQTSLQSLITSTNNLTIGNQIKSGITDATAAVGQLQLALKEATNVNTGNLDLTKFTQSMKASGMSLEKYQQALTQLGPAGRQAFAQLANSVATAEVPIRRSNALLQEMGTTIKNAARWQISSSIIHGFMGSIQKAYSYAQALNESLNNIQIVTGLSDEKMAKFAESANKAAKQLSTSTTSYTDAALIYYQQGIRDDQEIAERVETTIKLANVSGQSAQKVSDQMTAIWSNFADGSHNLEYYADVITALGAATASSSEEIATGLSKFAAVADTVGLSYENATAALATITATTRQSADTVGTGLRTLFARLQSLKLGETLEDGVSLTKYSQALESIGVQVLDATGNLRSMDDILDDMGAKWQNLTDAQKTATAQTVGGVRQYTTLMALMENFDFYKENQQVALGSEGTVQKQADIYAQSWEAASKRVKASMQSIYADLLDDKFFIKLTDGFAGFLNVIDSIIDGLGGIKGILLGIGTIITTKYAGKTTEILTNFANNIRMLTPAGQKAVQNEREKASALLTQTAGDNYSTPEANKAVTDSYQIQGQLQQAYIANAQKMTEAQQQVAQSILAQNAALRQSVELTAQELDNTIQTVNSRKAAARGTMNAVNGQYTQNAKFVNDLEKMGQDAGKVSRFFEGKTFDFSKMDASGLKDIQAQMQKLGISVSSFTAYGNEATQAFQQFNNALVSGNVDQASQAFDHLISTLQNGTVDANQFIESLVEMAEQAKASPAQVEALRNSLNDVFNGSVQAGQGFVDLSAKVDQVSNHAQQATLTFEQLTQKIESALSRFVGFAGGLTSFVMGINMVKSAITTLNNTDLTIGERISGALIPAIMGISMLTQSLNTLGITSLISSAFQAILQSSFVTTTAAAIGAALGVNGFNVALAITIGLLSLIVIGIVAVVAAFVMLGMAIERNWVTAKEEMENLKTATEEAAKAAQEAKDAYNDLIQAFDNYDSAVDKLNEMTVGTLEFQQALLAANSAALDLINNFGIKDGISYGENGEILISDEARKQAEQKAYDRMQETEEQLRLAEAQENYHQSKQDWAKLQRYQSRDREDFWGNRYSPKTYRENLENDEDLQKILDKYDMSLEEFLATRGDFEQFLTATGGSFKNRAALNTAALKDDGEISDLESVLIDTQANNQQFWDQMYNQSRFYTDKYGQTYDLDAADRFQLKSIYKDVFSQEELDQFLRDADKEGMTRKETNEAMRAAIRGRLNQKFTDDYLAGMKKELQDSKVGKFGETFKSQKAQDAINQLAELQAGEMTETERVFSEQLAQQMESSVNNYKNLAAELGIDNQQEVINIADAMKSISFEDMDKITSIGNTFKTTFGKESANKIFDELTTAVADGNIRVMNAARGLNLSGDIIKDLAATRKAFKDYDDVIDLNGLLETMKKEAGGKKGIFEELYHSEDFSDNLKSLQKTFKKTGKIGAQAIADMAEESEYLSDMLDESGITASGLADILESMEMGDIDMDSLSEQLIEAFNAAGELDNTLASVFSHIDNFQQERSTMDIGKFYKGLADDIEEAWNASQIMDPRAQQAWGELFGPESLANYRAFMAEITNDENLDPSQINARVNEQFAAEIAAMKSLQENGDLRGIFEYYGDKGVVEGGTEMFKYDKGTNQVVAADRDVLEANGWDSESGFIQGLIDNYGVTMEMAQAMAAEYASTNAYINEVWRETAAENGIEKLIGSEPTTEYSPAKGVYKEEHLAGDGVTTAKELEAFYNQYQDVLKDAEGNAYDDFDDFLADMSARAEKTGQAIVDLGKDFDYANASLDDLKKTMDQSGGVGFEEYLEKVTGTAEASERSFQDLEEAFTRLGFSAKKTYELIDETIKSQAQASGKEYVDMFKEQFAESEDQWTRFQEYLDKNHINPKEFTSQDWANFLNTDEAERQLQHMAEVMSKAIVDAFANLEIKIGDKDVSIKVKAEADEESAASAAETISDAVQNNLQPAKAEATATVGSDPSPEEIHHIADDFKDMQAASDLKVDVKFGDENGIAQIKESKTSIASLKAAVDELNDASHIMVTLEAPGEAEVGKIQSLVDQINQMNPTLTVTVAQVDENGNPIAMMTYNPETGNTDYVTESGAFVRTNENAAYDAWDYSDRTRAREQMYWDDGSYHGGDNYIAKNGQDTGLTIAQVEQGLFSQPLELAEGTEVGLTEGAANTLTDAVIEGEKPVEVGQGPVTRQGKKSFVEEEEEDGKRSGSSLNKGEKKESTDFEENPEVSLDDKSINTFNDTLKGKLQEAMEKREEAKENGEQPKEKQSRSESGEESANVNVKNKEIEVEASAEVTDVDASAVEPVPVESEADIEDVGDDTSIEVTVEPNTENLDTSIETTLEPNTDAVEDYTSETATKVVDLLVGRNEPAAAIAALPTSHSLAITVTVTVTGSNAFGSSVSFAGGGEVLGSQLGTAIDDLARHYALNHPAMQQFIKETEAHYKKGTGDCSYGDDNPNNDVKGAASGTNVYRSYVNGSSNRYSKPGISLTAEEGPEIIWNKQFGYAYIVGGDGHPEFAELRPGDRVFNANDTRQILNYHRPKSNYNSAVKDPRELTDGLFGSHSVGYGDGPTFGGGGGKGGGGGGEGDSGYQSYEPNRYHLIERQISDLTFWYDELAKAKDKAYGTNRLRYIDKEIEATTELISANKELLAEAEAYREQDLQTMRDLGIDFELDENGNIKNYEELEELYRRTAETSDDDAAKDAAQEAWDAIERYEETLDKIKDARQEISDQVYELANQRLEKITLKAELRVDFDDREIKFMQHFIDKIDDNIYETSNKLSKMGTQMGLITDKIQANRDAIDEIFAGMTDAYGNKLNITYEQWLNMSEAEREALNINGDYGEQLEELSDKILDYVEELEEYKMKGVESLTAAFEELNTAVTDQISLFDHYSNMLSSLREITDLQNIKLPKEFRDTIKTLNKTMVDVSKDRIKSQQDYYNELNNEANALQDKINNTSDYDLRKAYQEQLDDIKSKMRDTMEDVLSTYQDALNKAKELYDETMEWIKEDYESSLSDLYNSTSLIQDAFDRKKALSEQYVDDYEKYYQLGKLQRQINKDIDNAAVNGNKANKNLKKLLEEIQTLQENGAQLSAYDLDILSKKYEYEKALADLEDARNAKQTVRLQRDRNGNWGYVYTAADGDELAEQEQAVEDKLYEYTKAATEQSKDLQGQILSLWAEAGDKIAQMRADGVSEDVIDDYIADTQQKLNFLMSQLEKTGDDVSLYLPKWLSLTNDSFNLTTDTFKETILSMVTGMDNIGQVGKKISDAIITITEATREAVEQYNITIDALNKLVSGNTNFKKQVEEWARAIGDASKENVKNTQEALNNMSKTFSDVLTAAKAFEKEFMSVYEPVIKRNEDFLSGLLTALDALNKKNYGTADLSQSNVINPISTNSLGNGALASSSSSPNNLDDRTRFMNFYYGGAGNLYNSGVLDQGVMDWLDDTYNYYKQLEGVYGKPNSYDTGGYTGSWGPGGKLAVLHEKEEVFNKHDTENLLTAANILRTLDMQTGNFERGLGEFFNPSVKDNKQTLEQEVYITAEFPNATNHSEIEEAFNNLANRATQYANRKVG